MTPETASDRSREPAALVAPESLINVLGVIYVHRKTSDGGDIYLTQFGLQWADLLEVANWYEREWFEEHRERLQGTSAVYRVSTKVVAGRSLELVVKNCRVGEHVPAETKIIMEFIQAEFNSPWEEFSLVMELREGRYGPKDLRINTQIPLAIYVPPIRMQTWQTGRSASKINRLLARHPGIDIDILRQYKLIYGWIKGKNAVKLLEDAGFDDAELDRCLAPITQKSIADLGAKGYAVIDMKPDHVIISEPKVNALESLGAPTEEAAREKKLRAIDDLMRRGEYSVVDYELLIRTPEHEDEVSHTRRYSYLEEQADRFRAKQIPAHLRAVEIFGIPYIFGHAESTGGKLWVVGRNAHLFDYFLPERWRKTHSWRLSKNNEVFYTFTKDYVHIVWKTSRVGELPPEIPRGQGARSIPEKGFNSPFEEFAIAGFLSQNGVPTVYARAIYMTGSEKIEVSQDLSRFESHRDLRDPDGDRILRADRNYITVRGYFNGPDSWVAEQTGKLCRPMDLGKAAETGVLQPSACRRLRDMTLSRLRNLGYDGGLLDANDLLVSMDPQGRIVEDSEGEIEVRICNFELIHKL
ncbi:MAG: hypothetical protein JXA90_09870 [Planctomycetes bacterium]|nr:hypothetical protein [Planctomycetota bacterium]